MCISSRISMKNCRLIGRKSRVPRSIYSIGFINNLASSSHLQHSTSIMPMMRHLKLCLELSRSSARVTISGL